MKENELINLVMSYLPVEVTEDSLFTKLSKYFLSINKNTKLLGRISVSEDIYQKIINDYPSLSECLIVNKAKVFGIGYLSQNVYMLEILHIFDGYIILAKCTEPNKTHDITLDIDSDIRRWQEVIETTDGSKCEDYACNIEYYDESDNVIPEDTEAECDKLFSQRFLVPLPIARFLRTNFKTFKDKINTNYYKEDMISYDNILDDSELVSFKGPYHTESFKDDILAVIRQEIYEDLQVAGYDNPEDALNYHFSKEEMLDKIGQNLLSNMGPGEIVISKNILENLLLTLDGYKGNLYTKGYILKKLEGSYIFYYAYVEDENIILMPEKISIEQAQILFYKGENDESLSSFFNLGTTRK